ncbi:MULTISPECIES: hypothetical protein [Streptomyces]|uniref:hypothetical protein n=1 Tax=Streptomyces TaxID=1883 RepID=UPI0004CCD975|nr:MULTISPECIES: hypothetical protein [Streptomyces]KOT52697.1 hypothetical protein ADK43_29990 [Streptomyces rimosus subsp. rimosus]
MSRHTLVTAPRLPARAWWLLTNGTRPVPAPRAPARIWRLGITDIGQIVDALLDGRCLRCLTATEVHFIGAALHCGSQLPLWACTRCDRQLQHRVLHGRADECWGWCAAGVPALTCLLGTIHAGPHHTGWCACQDCDWVLRSTITTAVYERDVVDGTASLARSGSPARRVLASDTEDHLLITRRTKDHVLRTTA